MLVLKNIFYFISGIVVAWVCAWGVNILEWAGSLSIGSIFQNLFFADARGPLKLIYSLVSMFPYIFVWFGAMWGIMKIQPLLARRISFIIMGLVIITLFDPDIKWNLPSFLYHVFNFLQTTCYFKLLGGASLADFTWSSDMSSLDYGVFDFYMIILAIIGAVSKNND